ncbi:MAG: BatA domain-containing protein, partial [Acidobacteriota bacterium]
MSFLTPLFWLGLAATAVPIIVHLVRRTRAPRIEFPSLMFVRRVPQRTIRRRRIQNLLLLILRCLAFFLLVFAFVRPYFSDGKAGLDGASKAEVILIDRSFSMRMGDRFARARARAAELIADQSRVTGDGTTQAIILFDQGYEVVSQLTADRPLLAARLAEIRVCDGATNLDQALQAAESLLRAQPAATRTIHLLTDFQATGRTGGGTTYRPRPGIQIVPFDVGEVGGPNLAISEVTGVGTIHQPKYTDRLTARISNFGAELVSAAKVEFRLNDRPIEKREVSLPAGESRTLEFTGFNLTEGPNQASI